LGTPFIENATEGYRIWLPSSLPSHWS
jgi:hypothetical protein